MTLTLTRARRNPYTVLDEMDKMFRVWRSDWSDYDSGVGWTLPVDIAENENELMVKAEAPGLDKGDFKVSVENNVLTISGEKKQEFEEGDKGSNYHRMERVYGKFSRSFTLPSNVDVTNVKANYKNGILEVNLPRKEEAKPKEISVDVG